MIVSGGKLIAIDSVRTDQRSILGDGVKTPLQFNISAGEGIEIRYDESVSSYKIHSSASFDLSNTLSISAASAISAQLSSDILTISSNYLTSSDLNGFLTETSADSIYQKIGNYITDLPNSASWDYAVKTVSSNSAKWDNTYTNLSSNSANWDNTQAILSSNSAKWDDTYTNLSSNSANWDKAYDTVNSESANWTKVYDTVTANSANWDEVTEYSAGPNINITNNTISSKDWTPELSDKLNSTAFTLPTSANWDNTYSAVNSESANWNNVYNTVTANSANWENDLDAEYSAGPNIDITDNIISSKDWTPELNAKLDSTAFTLSTSANWDKAYDTVTANSANWDEVTEYSAGPNIDITDNNVISGRDWSDEINTKLNTSAFTLPNSANWDNTYSAVTANSAKWNEVNEYSAGSNIEIINNNVISGRDWTPELSAKLDITDFSNVSGKFIQTLSSSANWNNTYSAVNSESANWDKAYDTVTANSANWNNDLDTLYSAGSNINITNNTISSKDWTPELNAKLNSSAFSNVSGKFIQTLSTSSNWDNTYSTVNSESANWTKVYDTVTANSANWENDLDTLYSAGSNINITNNIISSKDWTSELSAKLDSSAFTLPISSNWTKAYDTVTANSANWENDIDVSNFVTSSTELSGSYILSSNGQNAVWSKLDENYNLSGINGIIISANSANKTIDVGYNGSGPISEAVYELRAGQNIGIQSATDVSGNYLIISANANSNVSLPESANWSNTYSTVTNNSANWNSVSSVTSNIINLSAGQNIGIQSATDGINDYLVISANAITEIDLPESANWTKAYDTVTANSANWNNDLDTLYSAGSNIDINNNNTISSRDWTPELSAKLDTSAFSNISGKFVQTLTTSANWDNTYSAVNSESANWTKAYDTVTANSANWNNDLDTLYSAGSNINITNNTISSKDWSYEINNKLDTSAFTLPNSANWDNTYDTVSSNSANWSNDTKYSAGSNINITDNMISGKDWSDELNAKLDTTAFELPNSANWDNTYNTISSNSATWNEVNEYLAGSNIDINNNTISSRDWTPEINAKLDTSAFSNVSGKFVQTLEASANWDNTYSAVNSESANWNEAYDMVTANSANWNEDNEYSAGPNIEITNNTISSRDWTPELSAKLDTSAFSNVSGKFVQTLEASANWNNVYNTVTTNSANWENEIDVSNFVTSSTNLSGSYILSSNGSTTTWHELEEEYNLSGFNGIIISADSANKTINVGYNGSGPISEAVYELRAGQNIGIQSATDVSGKDYLVISANAITEIDLPESANWNNTYSTVNSESANWNSVSSVTSNTIKLSAGQNIGIQSANDGISDYLVISANAITEIDLPESANWNNTYDTVNSESANWNSVSSVTGNILNLSAGQNIGIQSATDGINDYLVISANAITEIDLPESANWNNTYETVTANSASWDEVNEYSAGSNINITNNTISSKDWTPELNAKLNSTAFTLPSSANWDNTYSSVTNNSANWNSVSSVTGNILNLSAGQNIGIQSANDGTNDYLVISANAITEIDLPESANWTKAYDMVTANSANWNNDLDTLYSAGSNINITNNTISSKDWTPELNAKLNSTAFSDVSGKFVQTLASSANWTKAYDMVTANSANWNNDLDTLYSAGSNINITNNTISSKDWTPELNAKLNSSAFKLPTSANWNNTYSTVMTNSANWNNDLDTLYVAGSNINITNNTISSKDWTPELNTKLNSTAFTLPTSANWTKAYETVTANSASWDEVIQYSAGSNISITNNTISSKDWTPELNAKLNSTAFSNVSGKFVQTLPTSSNWTKAYDTVTANSASWNSDLDTLYSAGSNINITNNTISSKDWTPELNAKLNSTAFTLPSSANWDNTYSVVTANSANWNSDIDVSNFVTSSTDLSGSYILSSNGSTTTWHELEEEYELSGLNGVFISANSANKSIDISLTECYDISGFNGILVSANSANKTIDITYSGNLDDLTNNTFILQAGQNVVLTSGESGENKYLTISAAGIESIGTPYELSGGENINITSATIEDTNYLVISAKGGDSLGTPYNLRAGQNIGIQSATIEDTNYLVISANAITEIDLPESANWNNTYSTVNSESANWNSVSSVTSNTIKLSAGQNIGIQSATDGINDYLVISANAITEIDLPESANWNNTYETVNSESANWNSISSVTSNILNLSAGQNIGIQSATDGINDYLVISANAITEIDLPESANWNNTYETVNSESANWNNTYITVNSESANWNSVSSVTSHILNLSAGQNIGIQSATFGGEDYLVISANAITEIDLPESANWNNTYSTVNSESANWNNTYNTVNSESANWNNTYSTVNSESANWNSISSVTSNIMNLSAGQNIGIQSATLGDTNYLVISANSDSNVSLPESANWTKAYETVTANSASWDEVNEYSAGSNINITNNTISSKDWTPELNTKLDSTAFTLPTSANWNNTYSTVNSESANWNSVSSVTSNIMNLSAGQNIGIQSATDGINDYLIISANSNSNVSLPESANWTKAYDTVIANSANWNNDLDTLYSAGSNINITNNTISSKDWTPELNTKLDSTAFTLPTSANWNNTYSSVTNNSANWNSVSSVTGNILNLSAGQNIGIQSATVGDKDYLVISAIGGGEGATYVAGTNINITNNTISSKDWTPELNDKLNSTAFSLPSSSNWAKAYETVTANSANWNNDLDTLYSAGSNINITNNTISSKDWTPELNTKLNSSAFSSVSGKFVQTLPSSANWDNTYSAVTANSANWNSVSSVTGNILNLSAGQNIGIQSATDGINDYLVISAIGGGEGATYVAGSNIDITNNTISSRDWTPELNTKLNSTAFSNVSGKFVQTLPTSSDWTKAYDMVTANSANWNNDLDTLYSAGSNINITNNTISSKDWTPELNTKLNSSAFKLPTSAYWNNTYNTVTNNSANWNNIYSTVMANSSIWDEVTEYSAGSNINITNNTISSKDWTPELNTKLNSTAFKLPSSANWNNTHSTVTNNSADWSGMYSLVAGNSAYWGQGEGTVFELYSSNDTIGISSTTAAGNKIIYDISLEGTTTSRNYFINRQEQTDAVEYLPNTNLTLPDLGNGWQIVNGEANYGDIKYTSLSAYSVNGSAYIIPEEVKLASVDIRLDVIIPSGGLSPNYQKVEIVIFDDIKNEYIGKYDKWIDISYDRTEQLNFTEILTEPSSVKLYFRSEFACQTYCRTFSLVDLTYKILLINNNVTGGSISLPTSANWNNTYTTVTNNSANWNSVSSLSAKSDSILCQNISYTVDGSNINVTVPNNTYATISGLNVTGTINVIISATNVINGSELNSCAGRLMFSTNKPSTLNFVDSSTTSKLPVIGQLPTTYSGNNYQFTCVAGVVACQEIKTIT